MVVIRNPQIITNKAMIYSLRSEGLTLREIGEKFGISRESPEDNFYCPWLYET
jgi:DNA-binding CsgD family transcriptional regulator